MSDSVELPPIPTKSMVSDSGESRAGTMKLPFMPQSEIAREQREYLEQIVDERTAELRDANDQLSREIHERVTAQVALQHNLEYQHIINALLGLALKQAPMEVLLQRALDTVLSLPAFTDISAGAIFVADRPGTITLKVHQGLSEGVPLRCAEVKMGDCLCGRAAQARELMQVTQMGSDFDGACGTGERCGHCCLPISAEGEVLGVLTMLLPESWELAEWEVRVLAGVADVLANIISRKRVEARGDELEEQLRYSQKLEAVGRLAGGVAHDFNNLLTVIQGNVYLNLSDPDLPDVLREDLKGIEAASRRAATLTRQLLAFGRKQVLQPQEIEVNIIVRELEKMLRRVIGEDIDLRTNLADGLWSTQVDPGQLEQVILNLVVNARDAMPRGGQLLLETANVTLSPEDTTRQAGVLPGPYIRLTISDTGIGMDSDMMKHLFEPFFTTKEVSEVSSGLGLATSYGIVRQSGGYIEVESEPGQGTRFLIHLPRLEPQSEGDGDRDGDGEAQSRAEESLEAASQVHTILLVEDEDDVRQLVIRVLGRAGYRVLEAPSGGHALQMCAAYAGDIHMVLTDVVMPGLSGCEVVEQLTLHRPDLEVLFMSGYSGVELQNRGVDAESFLAKPFTPDQLLDAVVSLIGSPGER